MLVNAIGGGSGPSAYDTQRRDYRSAKSQYKTERRAQKRARRGPGLIGGVTAGVAQLTTGKKVNPQERRGPIGTIRNAMRQDVMYLLVAPLPSMEQSAKYSKAAHDQGLFPGDEKSGKQSSSNYGASGSRDIPSDAPPAYDEIAPSSSKAQASSKGTLMSGGPAMGDKKR